MRCLFQSALMKSLAAVCLAKPVDSQLVSFFAQDLHNTRIKSHESEENHGKTYNAKTLKNTQLTYFRSCHQHCKQASPSAGGGSTCAAST